MPGLSTNTVMHDSDDLIDAPADAERRRQQELLWGDAVVDGRAHISWREGVRRYGEQLRLSIVNFHITCHLCRGLTQASSLRHRRPQLPHTPPPNAAAATHPRSAFAAKLSASSPQREGLVSDSRECMSVPFAPQSGGISRNSNPIPCGPLLCGTKQKRWGTTLGLFGTFGSRRGQVRPAVHGSIAHATPTQWCLFSKHGCHDSMHAM